MSSNRQHRVHNFLCAPKITSSASPSVGYRVLFTMNNINPEDCCRVCSFVFVSKKRKRNIDGEFRKIFEEVFNQKLLTDDGLPHAVCDTCHYRVQRMWKSKQSAVVIRVNELSKRRHPLSPLTSSQGDEQTSCHISKKKVYRIPFENVPIRPKPPSLEMSCPGGSSRRSLLFFVPYFPARLDFPSPPLSAPGSPRMM